MFPSCSHEVLKLFPITFAIAPQIYPIRFAQSSTLMYINWKGGSWESTFVSVLWLGSKEVLLWGSAQCSKNIADGPINMAPSKQNKRQSGERTHELIFSMDHIMNYIWNFCFLPKALFFHIALLVLSCYCSKALFWEPALNLTSFLHGVMKYVVGLSYYTFGT